ncbi:MAG TPA: hypothetical protein VNA16_03675 [Abditibacteriaceae bacterium]|nr:hypothetical protein [Abditibacteriaceae bacterium]
MKVINKPTHFTFKRGVLVLLSVGAWSATGVSTRPAMAHKGDCTYCGLPIVQNTASQDNEVILKHGAKRVEYRCVYCALAEAKSAFKNDLSIVAPSEKKGKPVLIKRVRGKWSASPANPIFIAAKVSHRHCQTGYRAFTSRAAFNAHVKKHKSIVKDAKPLTLSQMVALAN